MIKIEMKTDVDIITSDNPDNKSNDILEKLFMDLYEIEYWDIEHIGLIIEKDEDFEIEIDGHKHYFDINSPQVKIEKLDYSNKHIAFSYCKGCVEYKLDIEKEDFDINKLEIGVYKLKIKDETIYLVDEIKYPGLFLDPEYSSGEEKHREYFHP